MRVLFLGAFMAVFSGFASAGETEWPQFRGPTGQGISKARNIPIEWSAEKGIAWKTEVAGAGWSSPVLSAGRLYLTTAATVNGGPTTLHVLCFTAADGHLVWDTEVLQPDPGSVAAMHQKNSPASATAIVEDGKIYVHFGHMGTAALDLDGKVLWRQTSLGYSPTHGNGGSPALAGDLLVFSADGQPDPLVAALDKKTGEVRWKTPRHTMAAKLFSFSTPLVIEVEGKTQIISPGSGFVAAYDPQNGSELWKVTYGEGYSVVPRPVYAHGLLYICSGFNKATLYAIDPKGAQGDVTATNVRWTINKGAPLTPSVLVVGDEIYFVADSGIATCANALTGEVYWTERLGGGFSASPVLADGRIYFQNETGTGFVIAPGKTYQLLAKNDLGEASLASYAVADGAIYLRTDKHLWKIGQP